MRFLLTFVATLLGGLPIHAQRNVLFFATIAEMVSAGPSLNSNAVVAGYYSPDDGGGGEFVLLNNASSTNLGTRIASSGISGHVWKRTQGGPLSVLWFGARLNSNLDSHRAITNAIDVAGRGNQGKITFPVGFVTVWSTINVSVLGGITFEGESPGVVWPNNGCVIKLRAGVANSALFDVPASSRVVVFSNLKLLDGNCNESAPSVSQLAGNTGIRAHGVSAADGGPGPIKQCVVEGCELMGWHRGLSIYDDTIEYTGTLGIGEFQNDGWSIRRNGFTYCATGIYSNTRNFDYSVIESCGFSTWTNGIHLARAGFVRLSSNAGGGIGAAPETFIRLGVTHNIQIEQCQSENYPRSLFRDYANPATTVLPLVLINNEFSYPYLGKQYAVTSIGNIYHGNVQASHDMHIVSSGDRFYGGFTGDLTPTHIAFVSPSRMRLSFASPLASVGSVLSTNLTLYLYLNHYPADTQFVSPYLEGRYPILSIDETNRTVDIFAYAITGPGFNTSTSSNHCTVFMKGDWQFGYDFTGGQSVNNGGGSYVVSRDSERYLNRYKESSPYAARLSYIPATGAPVKLFKKFAQPEGMYEVSVYGRCLTNDTITVTLSYLISGTTYATHNFYSAVAVTTGANLTPQPILVQAFASTSSGSSPGLIVEAQSANALHTTIGCSIKYVGEVNKTN